MMLCWLRRLFRALERSVEILWEVVWMIGRGADLLRAGFDKVGDRERVSVMSSYLKPDGLCKINGIWLFNTSYISAVLPSFTVLKPIDTSLNSP